MREAWLTNPYFLFSQIYALLKNPIYFVQQNLGQFFLYSACLFEEFNIFFATNDRGSLLPNIWAFCNLTLNLMPISSVFQHISFSVILDGTPFFPLVVYACTTYGLRRQLWLELADVMQNNVTPWRLLGYFKAVMGAHERGVASYLFPSFALNSTLRQVLVSLLIYDPHVFIIFG